MMMLMGVIVRKNQKVDGTNPTLYTYPISESNRLGMAEKRSLLKVPQTGCGSFGIQFVVLFSKYYSPYTSADLTIHTRFPYHTDSIPYSNFFLRQELDMFQKSMEIHDSITKTSSKST